MTAVCSSSNARPAPIGRPAGRSISRRPLPRPVSRSLASPSVPEKRLPSCRGSASTNVGFGGGQGVTGAGAELPITVQGAAYNGQLTHFRVTRDWGLKEVARPDRESGVRWLFGLGNVLVVVLTLGAGTFLGARNLMQRKGDSRTSVRVALATMALSCIAWILTGVHALPNVALELQLLTSNAPRWLWNAALLWCLYMALEPTVRSIWPHKLVSWTRLLSGRWRDPSVGRDLLLGMVGGVAVLLVMRGPLVHGVGHGSAFRRTGGCGHESVARDSPDLWESSRGMWATR